MLNHYETVFILTPVLSDDQVKEAVNKFRDFLTNNGAEIINDENWGLKKLAYKVNKKSTGFYQLFEYKVEPSVIQPFEVQLRRDERIMRFLSVKLDEHAVKFNEGRRKKAKDNVQGPKPAEELQN
ncbi:MAG: 30S ribosomal protein S6 [Bacteroidales bacterium]|nr:30S ribosomal protein S6 [Bacteroidales bacterium]